LFSNAMTLSEKEMEKPKIDVQKKSE